MIFKIIDNIKYENKKNIPDLLNPFNFAAWLLVSLKDIFYKKKNYLKYLNKNFTYKITR